MVVSICIRYVLACNAQIYHPARPVRWPPHGTATFEGGVLGETVVAGELGATEPNSVLRLGFPADGYWLC